MLSGRGFALLGLASVAALVGVVLGVEEFVLVAMAAASLLVFGEVTVVVQARRARTALVLGAEGPRREVMVGDDASATLTLHNRGRRASGACVVEEAPPWRVSYPGLLGARRSSSPHAAVPRAGDIGSVLRAGQVDLRIRPLPAGASTSVPVVLPTAQRGLWSLGSVRLWCCDPFGLVAVPVARTAEVHVVVVPRPAATPPADWESTDPDAPGRRPGGGDAERAVAPGGDEFAGLRPYVPGDRLTRLHWPVLARSGDLLVRDFVEPMEGLVEVHVDDRPDRIEKSVSRAAADGLAALQAGEAVAVRTGAGAGVGLVVPPGPTARSALLRALGMVGPAT